MQASKLARVRSDGFSNNRAMTRPGKSGSRSPLTYLAFRSSVMEKMRSISAADKSASVKRCRIASLLAGIRDWGLGIRFADDMNSRTLIPIP